MGNLRMNADQISYKGGEKPMSVEEAIKNAGNTGLAHTADIAPDFSTESAYNAGDLVYHNGTLYVFTASHTAGAWSTSDTQAVTVGGEITSLMSGLTNYNMVPKVRTVLGTILVSETEKVVTATKNGYIVVNTNNVGASTPTVRCYMFIITKEYGCVWSDTIPAYTGVYFGMLPVEAGDNVVIHLSGHNVDATVSQIAYS